MATRNGNRGRASAGRQWTLRNSDTSRFPSGIRQGGGSFAASPRGEGQCSCSPAPLLPRSAHHTRSGPCAHQPQSGPCACPSTRLPADRRRGHCRIQPTNLAGVTVSRRKCSMLGLPGVPSSRRFAPMPRPRTSRRAHSSPLTQSKYRIRIAWAPDGAWLTPLSCLPRLPLTTSNSVQVQGRGFHSSTSQLNLSRLRH